MDTNNFFQQAPVRNESIIGAQVYSHSGEFAPQVFDLELPARGIEFQFVRKYRAAHHDQVGSMGRGWTFTYDQWIEQSGQDILYHDGLGRSHRFAFSPTAENYLPPDGFYAFFATIFSGFELRQRGGNVIVFESPDSGGRLLAIKDRNGNALRFTYTDSHILVTDPFGRPIEIILEQKRVSAVRDHTQRTWEYVYDRNACLVEVIQPAIHGLSHKPQTRYGYDQNFRLTSITDPKGQTFLSNYYDGQGRIKRQEHGEGTFEFEYHVVGQQETGLPVNQTQVTLKNGGLLVLKHDSAGHVTERTQRVSASALSPHNEVTEGTVLLTTISAYNRHGELIKQVYPSGNAAQWVYDHENADPRAWGNLLTLSQVPAQESDGLLPLVTSFTYETLYQQLASQTDPRGFTTKFEYDARGNLSGKAYPTLTVQDVAGAPAGQRTRQVQLACRYQYNEAGQLIRYTDPSGAIIDYFYHPKSDPSGLESLYNPDAPTQTPGGYLAGIVRDPASVKRQQEGTPANLVTGFGYDEWGNLTTILDGKGNATHQEYDAKHNLISITTRRPFNYRTFFSIRRERKHGRRSGFF